MQDPVFWAAPSSILIKNIAGRPEWSEQGFDPAARRLLQFPTRSAGIRASKADSRVESGVFSFLETGRFCMSLILISTEYLCFSSTPWA